MQNRRLTGKFYIKRRKFWGGFDIMVEETGNTTCSFDFSTSPDITYWRKGDESDFKKLGL